MRSHNRALGLGVKITWRSAAHISGGLLGMIGVAYIVLKIYGVRNELDLARLHRSDGGLLLALAVLYGGGNVFLVAAWSRLLRYFQVPIDFGLAIKVYGVSQLAKYVPGNIFHLASRQALGMSEGIPAYALAKASAGELALIAVAGGVFGILLIPLVSSQMTTGIALIGFVVVCCLLHSGLMRFLSRDVALALTWQIVFLALSGSIFFVVLAIVTSLGDFSPAWSTVCGAYIVAWLAGLAMPGAPAGIGVRETVLLLLLGSTLPPKDLLLAALLSRMITIVGDSLFFMAGAYLNWKARKAA